MDCNIEVCVKDSASTTDKGRILENLTEKILRIQQYDTCNTVRITGIEIDVLATHKITGQTILVECKAWDNALPADVITKLLGNVVLKKASAGWLITTGPLSKDAKGIVSEWEDANNPNRDKLAIYTVDRVINLLLDAHIVVCPDHLGIGVDDGLALSDHASLLIMPTQMVWVIPINDKSTGLSTSVVAFDAKTGDRISSKDKLNDIKAHKNSYSMLEWISSENPVLVSINSSSQIREELNSVVPVISGDDWTDYRPARPEDFVGRKKVIVEIMDFFKSANAGESKTRLFSIKAPSGMGKSSIILKLTDVSKGRKYSKKFFIYAVDVRTALSSRYAEMALRKCFDEADAAGFTDVDSRNISASNVIQYLRDTSIQNSLAYLRAEGKSIILIFDQFEELFSKRDLYPLFDNVKNLCNEIDSLQSAIILGFAWKTDLTIPADHPAYFMWSNLSDRRKEFELSQFKPSDIKGSIKLFGQQLGEPVNPILSNYLTKQCQGYPWLLKKLCIHVFRLIHEGNTQDAVIGKRLNIVDLFDRDIADLNADQYSCVKEIAKDSPADYFSISESYGNESIQSLINSRIVIRRASKLTLYWDIFRDYVLNKTIPDVLLDYIPQMQFTSVVRVLKCLLKEGDLSTSEISEYLGLKIPTIDNIIIDVVMFGVVQKENAIIHLIPKTEEELIGRLQIFFKQHILYQELKKMGIDRFSYGSFYEVFDVIYSELNVNKKTKQSYCNKLYNWFVCLGLLTEHGGQLAIAIAPSVKTVQFTTGRVRRRGRHQVGNQNLFWGQTSPEKMIQAYSLISSGVVSYEQLKNTGYRNAIEVLTAAKAIRKEGDVIYLIQSMEDTMNMILKSDTITFTEAVLDSNPTIKNVEMGQLLSERFSRNWSKSSMLRYGNALSKWISYLKSIK